MFNIGGGEMVVIGVVALIVVGPKDLPQLFRKTGQVVGRMRAMADDFRRTMESAANEAGVKDMKRDYANLERDAKDFTKINDVNEIDFSLESEPKIKSDSSKTVASKSAKSTQKAPKK